MLSESYLYTREMIEEALEHLSPDGILCAQFGEIEFLLKPNRVVRYLGTARQAFAELEIPDFAQHVLVALSPGFGKLETATILIKKSPFTQADLETFAESTAVLGGAQQIYTPASPDPGSSITKAITLEGDDLEQFYQEHPYKVRPIDDDAPFFWHFVSFPDALFGSDRTERFNVEEGIGERLLIVLLIAATLLGALFLLAPLVFLRDVWNRIPHKLAAGAYFAALGLGFMFLEISLIQRLTLFLGYPTYSLTITLFAILLSTGCGSLLSERWAAQPRRAMSGLAVILITLVVFYELALDPIVDVAVGEPLALRIGITIALLAPLGLCLGCFMPLGLGAISTLTEEHSDEYVAWCWAVNGFFSVVASVLATVLSMTIGFGQVMFVGLAIYLIGILAFRRIPSLG